MLVKSCPCKNSNRNTENNILIQGDRASRLTPTATHASTEPALFDPFGDSNGRQDHKCGKLTQRHNIERTATFSLLIPDIPGE